MPQPPLLLDQIQIEPGSGDTLTIDRDSTDGAMQFVDAVITGGVLLPGLVGIRNITGVYVVGRAGDGAAYTTIQSALDDIPAATSSALVPSLVLVFPGIYQEDVTLTKDGVYVVGLGAAKIINNTGTHTITVKASVDSVPQDLLFKGLEIECDDDAHAAIYVLGADTFSTGTVTVNNTPLTAGDLVTVGGLALTGISGTRTSGSNDFSVNAATADAIAAEIVDAINDASNAFTTTVTAISVLNVVTLTAVTAGVGGDAITLTVTVAVPGDLTVSGATLAGGGAAGNMVLNGAMTVDNCTLVASGVGSYQIDSDTAGHIYIRGGTFRGSSSTSILQAANNAMLHVSGVEWMNDIQLSADSTADQPNDLTSAYEIHSCSRIHDASANLSGLGSWDITNCPDISVLAQDGDHPLNVTGCRIIGATTLGTTTTGTFVNTERGTLAVSGGTPTLAESRILGSSAFVVSATETIAFDITQPDALYTVVLDSPTTTETFGVANKLAAQFDIQASGAISGTVNYVVMRSL